MVSLHPQSWEKEPRMLEGKEVEEPEEEEEEGETVDEEDGGGEASVTDDSEPEWDVPSAIRRKVSFADAFGLDLVSVKEFDAAVDPPQLGVDDDGPPSGKVTPPLAQVDNHLSCLFSVPSGPDELRQRLREQKVELESIELLPGTATLRGVVRVANLCYHKSVYVRLSPDAWRSHFELPAFYVPGSSDRETDRFAFIHAVVPPVHGKGGTRVEFCLRYETEVGTFWANNRGLNYVLFCHQKAPKCVSLNTNETKECAVLHHLHKHLKGGQRSCLKANSRGDAEDRTYEVADRSTATVSEDLVPHHAEMTGRIKVDPTEILQDGTTLIGRRKAARPPLGEHRHPEQPQAPPEPRQPRRPAQHHHRATPAAGTGISDAPSVGVPRPNPPVECPVRQPTYHQIPLLALDRRAAAEGGGTVRSFGSKTPPPEEDASHSVCAVWQSFIRDDGCPDHSGSLPESVWLQRAAATPPSEQRAAPPAAVAAPSGEDPNRPTATREGRPVSASPGDRAAGLSGSCDTDPATPEGGSGKDEVPRGARQAGITTPVENNDAGARWTEHISPETRDTEGVRGRGGRGEGGGARGASAGERITSSGERGTTETTAAPQNARSFDSIWPGARPGDGLSPSGGAEEEEEEEEKGEVTGIASGRERNALAFREAFKGQGTKDGAGSVLSPFRRGGSAAGGGGGGAEEARLTMHDTEGEGGTGEEIFRPRAAVNTERSQREAGDKDCGGSGPNTESGAAFKHKGTHHGDAGPHANAFHADESCARGTNPAQSRMNANCSERDTSEIAVATPGDRPPARNEEGVSQHGTSDDVLKDEDAKVDLDRQIREGRDSLADNENPFPPNSFEDEGPALTRSEAHDHRLEPTARDEGPPRVQAPGPDVLTGERPSTSPGSSASSGTDGDNDAKPSTLKQEPCGETDADETPLTRTLPQTRAELLSDGPSLKSPGDETGTEGDEGKGVEVQQLRADERQSGPSECKEGPRKCLESEGRADISFRETFEAEDGARGGPQHPPELGEEEVEERERDEGRRGTEKGQREEATADEQRAEEAPTPGGRKAREVSPCVDGPERHGGAEDAAVSSERLTRQGEEVAVFAGGIGEGSDKGVPEEVLNWNGVSGDGQAASRDVSPGVKEEHLTSEVHPATHSPEGKKCRTTINPGIAHDLSTRENCTTESCERVNVVDTVGFNEFPGDLNSPARFKEHLRQISIAENNELDMTQSGKPLAKTAQTHQSPDQTPNCTPEENGVIAEPRGAPWLRQTHAPSKEKNQESLIKPKDRTKSYNDAFNQLEDLTVGHREKLSQSTAPCQDPVNYAPQTWWCSALRSARPVTKPQFCAILVALLCFLLYILSVCLYSFQWRRQRSATLKGNA